MLTILEITDGDIEAEFAREDVEETFKKHFPDGWTNWIPYKKDRRLRNLFFLEETDLNGDCFWSSLCKILILEGDLTQPSDPVRLREKVMAEAASMKIMNTWVMQRFGGDKSKKAQLVKKYSKSGQYTDEDGYIVHCAAEVLRREIRVVQAEYLAQKDPRWYKAFPPEESEVENKSPVWLAYSLASEHFRALFSKTRYKGIVLPSVSIRTSDSQEVGASASHPPGSEPATQTNSTREKNSTSATPTPDQEPHVTQLTDSQQSVRSESATQKRQRRKLTPEESDELRRRKELAKTDLQLKLDAAELHVINLTKTIGQGEEKMKLMQERLLHYEHYTDYLEKEISKMKTDPGSKFKDLAFTSSDHSNLIRMRDTMETVVSCMNTLTNEVQTLKDNGPKIMSENVSGTMAAAVLTRDDPRHNEAVATSGEAGADSGDTASKNSRPTLLMTHCDSPTRMSFVDKVRKFSNCEADEKKKSL